MPLAGLVLLLGGCSAAAVPTAVRSVGASPAAAMQTPAATPAPGVTASPSMTADLQGRLLFSRFIEATHTFSGMFVSRPDGSGETPVPLPGPEGGGRWSRSGTQIAVMTVLPDGRIGTAIIGPDESVARVFQIPDPTLNVSCTVWSPDDARLACEAWDDGNPARDGIYTVRASDGGDLQRLTTPPAGLKDLPGDYAPDGQFVFQRHPGDEGDGPLLLVDAGGGEPRQLSPSLMEDAGRFSPDGSAIVTSGQGHLEVIDLHGTVVHRIEVPGAYLFGPVWSPDGTRIAFSMSRSGPFAEIYTSLPDGADQQQVTSTPDNEIGIDWAAEGG
jgi:hypothetical protein